MKKTPPFPKILTVLILLLSLLSFPMLAKATPSPEPAKVNITIFFQIIDDQNLTPKNLPPTFSSKKPSQLTSSSTIYSSPSKKLFKFFPFLLVIATTLIAIILVIRKL